VADFLSRLFSADFMPHVYCLRDPELIKLHFISDGLIAAAYAAIPLALLLLLKRRRDLAFPSMFTLFAVFIFGCGLTHVMGIITLWHPLYRLDGLIKAITAWASVGTAVLLFRLLPKLEALPSTSALQKEIALRRVAEEQLRMVSERALRESEARLRNSEERFRGIAEAVPNLLWTTSSTGTNSYVSARYLHYTGLRMEEVLGDGWMNIVHPEDRQRTAQVWTEAVATTQPYEIEYRLRRYDGQYCWFVARAVPVIHNGEVTQWIGSSTDIDNVKRIQSALMRSNEDLRQFAYVAAHDLQEPLRNISHAVQMLRRTGEPNGDRRWLELTYEGTQRMIDLVRDLLSYSRIVAEEVKQRNLVSAQEAVDEVLHSLNGKMERTGAMLTVASPLPQVCVAKTHLVQLFQNILGNALKYRKPDVAPDIRISVERVEDFWRFDVSDNGIGFNPEFSDRIFGVFKRLHTRQEYPGNGIGLSICSRIASHYNGRIWATGKPGEGACFSFTLPAKEQPN
jgi:PAS domain S-box-containing protein